MSDRRGGRPSVADERQAAILDAYIHLLAEAATVRVPVSAVAKRAGVARTAIAHFVGDHRQLHLDAARELARRYAAAIRSTLGGDPSGEAFVDMLFGDAWATNRTIEDQAFDQFVASAAHEPEVADSVRHMYGLLVADLAVSIRRDRPDLTAEQAENLAYCLVCLAETNVTMLQVGGPVERSHAARVAAHHLLTTWTP